MASIEQCPGTSEARTSRSNINKCPTLDNYHCLKTEDGQLRELCTSPIWIEAGKFKKTHYSYICKLCLLTETSTLVCLKKERKKDRKQTLQLRLR